MKSTADVIVIGAGALGAACAYFAAQAGFSVIVVDRGQVAGGTTSACEGNLLVSDKNEGPELDLALYSQRVWRNDLGEHGHLWEFESKGGLVVTGSEASAQTLRELACRQRRAGITVDNVPADEIADYEPYISPDLCGAAFYPEDAQVQPTLMAAQLIRLARRYGRTTVLTNTEVSELLRSGDQVEGIRTNRGDYAGGAIINAAGPWASTIAEMADVFVPVLPRRGFVLVTEPLPQVVFHKVYAGDYIAATQSSEIGLQTSPVVESTAAGTVLIGSSRERVGFDRTISLPALRKIAREAGDIFPALRTKKIMRSYMGYRPYCPDHLPAIGHDPRAPGLWHLSGHEGAGIGLAVGSAKLLVQSLQDEIPDLDIEPFAPDRFTEASDATI